jgi:TolA-binding protein
MKSPLLTRVALLTVVLVLWALLPTSRAQAQMQSREAIALQNQILEMRHDMDQLREQAAVSSAPSALRYRETSPSAPNTPTNDIVATLLDRVSQLEDQVRRLRGRVDELSNQVQRQSDDFTKQIGDLTFRLQSPPGGAGTPQAGAASARAPATPTAASQGAAVPPPSAPPANGPTSGAQPPRTPEVALQQGSAALARRDYAAAEAAAREVLATRGPRAYDAQLLLAEALIGKREFQQAALAYDDTYNKSHTGAHAQDALLGLANALLAINEKRAACDTLNKLRSEFPQPRLDIKEAAGAMRQRGGCA